MTKNAQDDKMNGRAHFIKMSLKFKIRDLLSPPKNVLAEIGIKNGFHLLDYGCGPGGFIKDASRMVGKTGKVYDLDLNSIAIKSAEKIITRKKLKNVKIIRTNYRTSLPDRSIDVVLLYDIFHHLDKPDKILKELHRILNPKGILSFSDHHMEEDEIVSGVTDSGLFVKSKIGKKTYSFVKK